MRTFLGTILAAYAVVTQVALMFNVEQSVWRENLNDWVAVAFSMVWLLVFVLTTRATYKGVVLADWDHWDGRDERPRNRL